MSECCRAPMLVNNTASQMRTVCCSYSESVYWFIFSFTTKGKVNHYEGNNFTLREKVIKKKDFPPLFILWTNHKISWKFFTICSNQWGKAGSFNIETLNVKNGTFL